MIRKSRIVSRSLPAARADFPEGKLSQLVVAIRAGMSRDTYWHIEHGFRAPTPAEKQAIAKALRTSVSRLRWPALQPGVPIRRSA